jgi:predicted DNA-binding ribbon-helix-helix protein
MWEALRDIAAREGITASVLVTRIREQYPTGGLTSSIRVYMVEYYRAILERKQSVENVPEFETV